MAESQETETVPGTGSASKPKAAPSADAQPAASTSAPPSPDEAPDGATPVQASEHDLLGQESIDEFAESVVFGLAQAGLDFEGDIEFSEKDAAEILELPDDGDAYFEGWGSFTGAVSERDPSDVPPPPHASESLLQLHLSEEVTSREFEERTRIAEIDLKHDELADAVQAALASVYGDHYSHPQADGAEVPLGPHETVPRWGGIAPNADGRTPQDVIFNYFDYEPEGVSSVGTGMNGVSAYSHTASKRRPPAAYETNGAEAPSMNGAYPYATLPVPAGAHQPYRVAPSPERESGRLLGAAAIGLIGGIAIAATLAVFLISSYGPDKTSFGVPGPRSSAETGYGVAPAPVLEPPSETLAADLTATPGQPAPLAISVRSPRPFEQTLVSISGVPQGARLSAGVDAGNGNWLLPPRRLNGLTITLPPGTPEQIPLEVQLLDSSARTALSEKSRFFIRLAAPVTVSAPPVAAKADNSSPQATSDSSAQKLPAYNTLAAGELSAGASAPPVLPQPQPQPQLQPQPAMPSRPEQTASAAGPPAVSQGEPTAAAAFQTSVAPAPPARSANQAAPTPPARSANQAAPARRPMPSPEVEDLIREGNKRMREGDILEARRYYFKAVASGDPEAALAMGRSYDPIYFARIERKNGEPDPAKALEWYRKAMEGGAVQTAKVRIENLKRFLNE